MSNVFIYFHKAPDTLNVVSFKYKQECPSNTNVTVNQMFNNIIPHYIKKFKILKQSDYINYF